MIGADLVCSTLRELGASCVFGLPGTQNTLLYESLRTSGLRSVVASDEGAAAFMAAGHARASGGVGVLTTIPGPGFLYALAGVAEARDDSVPLLWLTLRAKRGDLAFPLQAIDQPTIAAPLVKRCVRVETVNDIAAGLRDAWQTAMSGEPGPVLVELGASVLSERVTSTSDSATPTRPDEVDVRELVERIRRCERPLIYAGQGAQGVADGVRALAHRWRAPVLVTCSGRGVLPDRDAFAFVQDFSIGIGGEVPEMLERADLILVLGCKFTHNGSSAERLALPSHKLVRIDSSSDVLAANYPASLAVHGSLEAVVPALLDAEIEPKGWSASELAGWHAGLAADVATPIEHEPVLVDCERAPIRSFFEALETALGPRVLYTTDAGLHQVLTRRYAVVTQPRGLLCPSDFQSMGFGLAGAIGAALARPDAQVVACIGDGGLALSAGELLTAMREQIDLCVVVFNDASFGLIRRQQIQNYGHTSGVGLRNPDFAALAQSVGCTYVPVKGQLGVVAQQIADTPGVRLIELRLGDTPSLDRALLKGMVRARVRTMVPDGAWQALKRLLRS